MNHLGHFIVGQIIRTCFERNITMNTPTPEEIKAAREWFQNRTHGYAVKHPQQIEHVKNIDFALRFTEKMIGEPSEGMMLYKATCQHHDPYDMSCVARSNRMRIFKAMRDQAIKEIT